MSNPHTTAWLEPPAPLRNAPPRVGGYTSTGLTNTQLGDAVEAALEQLGFESALSQRQGPIDVTWSGYAIEVKACTRESLEYKAKPKAREVVEKREAANALGMEPATVIVVVDGTTGWVYLRPGIGAFRLTKRFTYLGQIEIEL